MRPRSSRYSSAEYSPKSVRAMSASLRSGTIRLMSCAPWWTIRKPPPVNLEFPPRLASGARSIKATLAPCSAADNAAHSAAFPPPITTTSKAPSTIGISLAQNLCVPLHGTMFHYSLFRVRRPRSACQRLLLFSERLIAQFKDVLKWVHLGDNFAALDHGFADEVPPPIGLCNRHSCRRIHALDRGPNDALLHAAPIRHDRDHLVLRGFISTIGLKKRDQETPHDLR